MIKLNKDFFTDNEVLFVGYSGKNAAFSKGVYQAFTRNGIKVFPLNSKENGTFDVKVYKSLTDLPKVPKTAYVLLNKENSAKVVKQLADNGVKRILFQSTKNVNTETLVECGKLGIDTVVACPMMAFGKGLHKVHGFFAGVRS